MTVLIAMTITTNAQIPNNGFENWTTVGSYEDPTGVWKTPNSSSPGPFYPVTKSSDHYPAIVGNYSIRLESDTSLLPSIAGFGITLTNLTTIMDGPGPSFPITGHPTSLCGWYKFIPQNNDTMVISILLYHGGDYVAYAIMKFTTSTSAWTSFNLPLSSYVSADSASIVLSAYCTDGPPPTYVPRGNSVLYVDNLSFDNLINLVPEQTVQNNFFNLYPNPASDIVTLNISTLNNAGLTLNIYTIAGTLVKSETLKQNHQKINISDLSNGIYMVEIKTKGWTEKQKLMIQR